MIKPPVVEEMPEKLETARKKMVHRMDALTVDRRDAAIEDAQRYAVFYCTQVAASLGEATRALQSSQQRAEQLGRTTERYADQLSVLRLRIDAMKPIVEAAIAWDDYVIHSAEPNRPTIDLIQALKTYRFTQRTET